MAQPSRNTYSVIGLMSGTSLDGLDIVWAEFSLVKNSWIYNILAANTIPYSSEWKERLRFNPEFSATDLLFLHADYGKLLAEYTSEFLKENSTIEKLPQLISSHGHTIYHRPEVGITLQIGDGHYLNYLLKLPVVNNFRFSDVVAGGEGAPLVPIGDQLLFSDYEACLNLGGFGNISFEKNNERIAFDICPVNYVLNHYVSRLNLDYDKSGAIAQSGKCHSPLLRELNELDFYHQNPPRSLGAEWVHRNIYPLIGKYKLPIEDILHTFCQHIAQQISLILENNDINSCLCTGGGVYHNFLMQLLRNKVKTQFIVPDKQLIEFKEALIFAFLGVLKLRGEVNILCSVTGSDRNHSSGDIHDFYQTLK